MAFALGGVPMAAAFLWYNRALTGSPLLLPMSGFETYTARWLTPVLAGRAAEVLGANDFEKTGMELMKAAGWRDWYQKFGAFIESGRRDICNVVPSRALRESLVDIRV